MHKRFWIFAVGVMFYGCTGNEPMVHKTSDGPIVTKQNFRTMEKEGYVVEVWTAGMHGVPISMGFRVYMKDKATAAVPNVNLALVLKRIDGPENPQIEKFSPTMRRTLIEGGYYENIRIDEKQTLERKGKFTGQAGVWEVDLESPFKPDSRKNEQMPIGPGKYNLSITVAIDGGPTFAFENIPYRIRRSRADND
jgi:hypothetical protein